MVDNILVWPQSEIEFLAAKPRHEQLEFRAHFGRFAVISITAPGDPPAYLPEVAESLLRLEFNDVESHEDGMRVYDFARSDYITLKAMTEDDAEAVKDFAFSVKDKVDLIIVHCQAGISRSAGVAAAVADGIGLPVLSDTLIRRHEFYNKFVYTQVLRAFHVTG